MATVLITGATGLVGFRVLCEVLRARHVHKVRYVVRSEAKANAVSTNPAVRQALLGGDAGRLESVVVPDTSVDGAFDSAVSGVTHIIHAGTPVARPTYDPVTEIFEPTVRITANLLKAAIKEPSVKSVVITSSIIGLPAPGPSTKTPISPSDRVPLPDRFPTKFSNVFDAYTHAKILELHQTDEFVEKQQPHFTVAHIFPGYVLGRNELMLDAEMMTTQNSSNNFLMMAILGAELPFPIHGCFVHIDDIARLHMEVAFSVLDPKGPRDFAGATEAVHDSAFGIVQRKFPKATAAGVFKPGKVPNFPASYDSSAAKEMIGNLRGFDDAVIDVAAQYLEQLGVEKA